jgi:hypothetical protein
MSDSADGKIADHGGSVADTRTVSTTGNGETWNPAPNRDRVRDASGTPLGRR